MILCLVTSSQQVANSHNRSSLRKQIWLLRNQAKIIAADCDHVNLWIGTLKIGWRLQTGMERMCNVLLSEIDIHSIDFSL